MLAQRWHDAAIAGLARLKKHPWRWSVVLALGFGFLLSSFLNWRFDGWASKKLWEPLMRFLEALIGLPVGPVGLVVALGILAFFLLALLDSSPIATILKERLNRSPKPKPLTTDQRLLIGPLRAGWLQYCRPITDCQLSLFGSYQSVLGGDEWRWSKLVRPLEKRVQATKAELDKILAEDSNVSLEQVKNGLAKWYGDYLDLADAMANMRDSEVAISGEAKLQNKLADFRRNHAYFRDEMLKLANGMPEYADLALFSDMHIEWRIHNRVTAEFLLGPSPQGSL
jgi:hypothetical protein